MKAEPIDPNQIDAESAVVAGPGLRLFNPWVFVPLLYFMQAIPVTIVQEVASIVYKDLGVATEPITRWTSLIALPWSLQLLLGPFVDLNFTKRRWILGGQMLICLGLIAAVFSLKTPRAFEISLVILGFTAVCSALTNIATDGFYLMSLTKGQQAAFVGVQSTCYRLGRLFCVGLLVKAAGMLAERGTDQMTAWIIALGAGTGIYLLGHLVNRVVVPRPVEDAEPHASESPGGKCRGVGAGGEELDSKLETPNSKLKTTNTQHPTPNTQTWRNLQRILAILTLALSGYFLINALVRLGAYGLWMAFDGSPNGPLKGWILGDDPTVIGWRTGLGGVGTELAQLALTAFLVAASFIAAKRLLKGTEMADAFSSYVRQPGFIAIFFFILFYRFGEAMVVKMSPLFLKDSLVNGGLGLDNNILGNVKGFAGVIGIVVGGLLGGYVVSRMGLRRSFWPLAVVMHLPNLLYLWASYAHPQIAMLYGIEFVDQFGYGFGFAAYMVYLMQVAQRGRYKTSHFAIGTGMGALCIAIAGVMSGVVQSNFGYTGFFIFVIFATIPGMLSLLFIPLDEDRKPAAV